MTDSSPSAGSPYRRRANIDPGGVRAAIVVIVLSVAPSAMATWSIVMVDSETKEVAVGTVTCLTQFDLLATVPVVVTQQGGGAVQSAGDTDGARRPVIFNGLQGDTPVQEIFETLETIDGHQMRQYGIVDDTGGKITFSGNQNGEWAGGVVGQIGTIHYAIQGNVLSGACVIEAAEHAVVNTDGDIPAKLMAGMLAARLNGGDAPTSCGCPPDEFVKSGHIGTMVIARAGDTDDNSCDMDGCADGDYFMKFNVALQDASDPDPVSQLLLQFNAWRAQLVGRPDAVQSHAVIDVTPDPTTCRVTPRIDIQLHDWQQEAITAPVNSITIAHTPQSAGIASVNSITSVGNGRYTATLQPGSGSGIDQLRVTVNDGFRPVTLMPEMSIGWVKGDQDIDADLDLTDFALSAACVTGPTGGLIPTDCVAGDFPQADADNDGDVDLHDLSVMMLDFTGPVFDDCNQNGQADACDLACAVVCTECNLQTCGQSFDCNGSGIVDECEADCNSNGLHDSCDITGGTSGDCNTNAIPDECDTDCNTNGIADECEIAALITVQPQSMGACQGESASFIVEASVPNATYQWRRKGVALVDDDKFSGTTTAMLTISDVQPTDAVTYACEVSNGCLSAESDPAALSIIDPPVITDHPDALVVRCLGGSASFSVAAGGTGPFNYQWLRDDQPIGAGNAPILVLNNLEAADAGSYTCVVSNACGSVESNAGVLELCTPIFTQQPESQCVASGDSVTFEASATACQALSIFWKKDGQFVPGASGPTLTLTDVSPSDAGTYTASAFLSVTPFCTADSAPAILTVDECE